MGLFDFWWNVSQASELDEHDKEIKQLKEKVEILKQWVDHLQLEINQLKKDKQ
jgi:phage shock protein A